MGTSTGVEDWPGKAETARLLGISERTLDRLIAEGSGPEKRLRQRPGRRPESVFNPADIETQTRVAPYVTSEEEVNSSTAYHFPTPFPLARTLDLIERLKAVMTPPPAPRVKMWMTVEEASEYTGLSCAYLRRLIKYGPGALLAVRDGAWKIRRIDLDNLSNGATVAKVIDLDVGIRTNGPVAAKRARTSSVAG